MASPYDVYVDIEDDLLDLKLTHLFVLQQMAQRQIPKVRYQLMQNARKYLGSSALSTAKFYRILDKLYNLSLVSYEIEESQKMYSITDKGLRFASSIKELVVQPGISVLDYFEPQFEKISNLVFKNASNALIIDFSDFVELPVLEFISSRVEFLSIISDRSRYEWLKREIPNLRFVEVRDKKLVEPNNSFDTILAMYPANCNDLTIFSELGRTLRSEGRMFVYEAADIEPNHYLLQILFNIYAPSMYQQRKNVQQTIDNIVEQDSWRITDKMEINGLMIFEITKAL